MRLISFFPPMRNKLSIPSVPMKVLIHRITHLSLRLLWAEVTSAPWASWEDCLAYLRLLSLSAAWKMLSSTANGYVNQNKSKLIIINFDLFWCILINNQKILSFFLLLFIFITIYLHNNNFFCQILKINYVCIFIIICTFHNIFHDIIIYTTTFHDSKLYLRSTPAPHQKLCTWRMWKRAVLEKLNAHQTLVKIAVTVLIVGVISIASASVLTSVTHASTTWQQPPLATRISRMVTWP